jgi:hypothetical protein
MEEVRRGHEVDRQLVAIHIHQLRANGVRDRVLSLTIMRRRSTRLL